LTLALQYKGFDYVAFFNGAYEDSDSLPELAQTGANSIEATLDYGINVNTSQVVADPDYTDSLAALGSTIAQAEQLGLTVMVRPLIDFLDPSEIGSYSAGEWRQDYQPTNVAAFFASYQQMIVAEAQVAQANGAQMFSIGAELDQLAGPQYLSYWISIIDAVRAVFSGKLTYSASWQTAADVSFWNELDYEGIDCYVPLSTAANPTLQDLIGGWTQPATQSSNPNAYAVIGNQSPISYFENLSAQSGKPLIFTELGYANDSDAAAEPFAEGNSPDPALQAELYQAFFDAWQQSGNSSLVGTYFWEWDPNSANGGPDITSFSPQNNPAQGLAASGFGNVITLAPTSNAGNPQAQSGLLADSGSPQELIVQTDTAGDGWLILNVANTYSGGTVISGGTVETATASALGSGGLSLVSGTLDMNGLSLALPTLYGGGTIVASAAPGQQIAGQPFDVATLSAGAGYFSGALSDGAAAAGSGTYRVDLALTKTGPGRLVLADADTYSGGTILENGFLELAASGSIAGGVQFTGNATLQLDSSTGQISGAISGATGGDSIDLRFVDFVTGLQAIWQQNGGAGMLDLETSGGATLATLALSGQYAAADFSVATDNAGGTLIDVAAPSPPPPSPPVPSPPPAPNPSPPASTTAEMIMRNGGNGDYEICDLGSNTILAAGPLGQVGLEWQVAGVGGFDGTDTSDMILRNSGAGQFELYDISSNAITNATAMGQVGLEWQVAGFGDFSSRTGETDMLMRNSNTGAFEIYDISNNAITSAAPIGPVGLEWTVAGFGDFSTRSNETDMLMRSSSTGAFEVYDINNNQITSAGPMGQVGLQWSVAGFGDFSGNANETDMLMRNNNTGAFEIYDINNNTITSAAPMGQVGLEWQVTGFGPIDGARTSDMLMQNTFTGAFEIYDISDNQLTAAAPMGQVGPEWAVAGIAGDPMDGSVASSSQLAQTMASFGSAGSAPSPSLQLDQAAIPLSVANLFAPTTAAPPPA
jgi:autotransporter-associated beta strand protein